MLYGSTGSTQGWCRILDEQASTLGGTFNWYKADLGAKSASRSYKRGIPSHDLTVSGYISSTLDAPTGGVSTRRFMRMSEGGLALMKTQMFKIVPPFRVEFPPYAGSNHMLLKFATFDPKTGAIKGTFYYQTRVASFEGLLFSSEWGFGHFLLPEAADETGETLNNTPIRSGKIKIEVDSVNFY